MAKITLTQRQLDLIIGCVVQCAEQDRAYIEEHGEKRAGPHAVFEAQEEEHLVNLFDLYQHKDGTNSIDSIQIVG